MASRTSAYTTAAPSATGLQKRTVPDEIRNLFPACYKLTSLVADGQVKRGELLKQKGMIGKKATDGNLRVEGFTYTPLAHTLTASAYSGTTLTVADSTDCVAGYTLFNTHNYTMCRIDSVTAGGTALEFTSVGSTAFTLSAASGAADTLIICMPAYPENSSSPAEAAKTEDNFYNVKQIPRFKFSISATAKVGQFYGTNDYWKRIKEVGFIEGMRKVDAGLMGGARPSSNNVTSGGAVLTDSFPTGRGLVPWANGNDTFDAQGALTPAMFRKDMIVDHMTTVASDARVIGFTSKEVAGRMNEWAQEKIMYTTEGDIGKYGARVKKYMTGSFDVELEVHDFFNQGSMKNQMLLFVPDELYYCFTEGRDLQPRKGIQNNDVDGYADEIFGEMCLMSLDGFASTLLVKNIYAL